MGDLDKALAIYGFRAPQPRRIEYAGIAYECNLIHDRLALGLHAGPVLKGSLSNGSSTDSSAADLCMEDPEEFMDKDDDKYYKYVSKLDPNNYKDQDHYRVLGLAKLRYKATMGQIKTAYRQKVLIYHPDKGKATKNGSRNEAIFACIQKAFEQLGVDVDKRRAYDSVDPKFDETVPQASDINENNFFKLFGPFFERNSRFSTDKRVPLLGTPDSSREDVEHFYDFWFHFKSWREFSYHDAEDKSRGEDRWERREIEKTNRIEREKLRKDYVKRLSSAVELAYEKDPRVSYFRDADKRAKQDAKDRKRLEKQRLAEELREQQRVEAERQKAADEERRAKEQRQKAKKLLQAERKRLRELVQSRQYFTEDTNKRMEVMEHLERLCLNASHEQLVSVIDRLSDVKELTDALEMLTMKKEDASSKQPTKAADTQAAKTVTWSQDEISLLIKATNIYPAGSVERWTQVAKYVNDHSKSGSTHPKSDKEVITQVKRIKSMEAATALQGTNAAATPPAANPDASEEKEQTNDQSDDSWSPAQQKQLETALKSTDTKDPERWEKISKAVEGKTKKQCVQRYKQLVQMIKNNKGN